MFPFAGLLIEKLRKNPGREPPLVRFPVYACPTFRNDVFFELGGLAAEKDGYPVLFTATHNTESVNDKNVAAKRDVAWDLAMAYVTRNFDTKPASRNPFDILASGILAKGYAEPEGFTVDNVSWDPKAADWSMLAPRKIMRQVCWLTSYDQDQKETKKATVAKLIKLRQGKYVAIWEEQVLAGKSWQFIRTMGTTLTIEGDLGNKRIKKEPPRQLSQCRLHRGDDPVTLTMGGVPHAAWVTAGRTNKQLILHTLDEKLTYKEQVLAFP